ncbi:MAG: DUF1273 family protein [Clostridia bacterium]|nr:DUF1273 family protein [Clostridia bacterium]
MASCFFIGHRETGEQVLPRVTEAVEQLILNDGVNTFYVGNYGGFDHLAASAVKQIKQKYPEIKLYLVIPYHPADRPVETPAGYNGTFYPDGMETVSYRYAIPKANRKMVETCDFLIACVTRSIGNSYKVLEYARRREKKGLIHVMNLGDKGSGP